MDSGISSAGNGLALKKSNNTSNESTSPTSTCAAATRDEQHRTLDELLSDMLMTVENIPDLPSSPSVASPSPYGHRGASYQQPVDLARSCDVTSVPRSASKLAFSNGFTHGATDDRAGSVLTDLEDVHFIDAEVYDAENIPYHARQDSRPFTYGAVPASPQQSGTMMKQTPLGLASPSLVRKASFRNGDVEQTPSPRGVTYNGGKTTTLPTPVKSKVTSPLKSPPLDYIDSEVLLSPSSDYLNGSSSTSPRSPEFHDGSVIGVSGSLTWLQRQQQKLRERQSGQPAPDRRPSERRLVTELHTLQHHGYKRVLRPSASHRDGYTSDTTHFADDDDDEDFTVPLHVNVAAPKRCAAGRHASESAFDRERPFVAVKRAHEQNRRTNNTRDQPDSTGLLSMVEELQHQQLQHQQRGVGTNGRTMVEEPPHQQRVVGTGTNQQGASAHHDALSSLIASLAATSSANSSVSTAWHPSQFQDESFSSWRSTSTSDEPGSPPRSSSPRPQTPAFPVHPRTPYSNSASGPHFDTLGAAGLPPKSPTAQRREYAVHNGSSSPTVYTGQSRRSSIHSNSEPPQEVSPMHVKFVRDTSRYWYKPSITREEAIGTLRDQPPGTFVVRDSNSFPGAFGLALKVATAPPAPQGKTADPGNELVRHFLIEPTSRGVKLKGCSNEPVFSSLSALVYQHSLTAMALPCLLALPEVDSSRLNDGLGAVSSAQLLLAQGAACNVLYLFTTDCESLTGPQAIKKAVQGMFETRPLPHAIVVHFKVSGQGITLTDSKRQLFFRRHYPTNTISHCSLDPDDHRWSQKNDATGVPISSNRCFGFVARKSASKQASNQCHIFAELEPEQPASAIVNFVCKVITNTGTLKANIV